MKTAAKVGALVVVLAAAVATGQSKPAKQSKPPASPREELKQIHGMPERPGKSLKQGILHQPGQETWSKGPPSLPPGAEVMVLEGDPATADRLFTLRLKLPAGYRIPPHFHGTDEHITVISGEFELGMSERFDEKALRTYGPGAFLAMPAGHVHFARTRKETVIQLHGAGAWTVTYVDPANDPRLATGGAGEAGRDTPPK